MAGKRTKVQVDESKELQDKRSPKTVWHPLNLQRVPLGRFVDLVNQILAGKLGLFESSLKGASATRNLDEPPADSAGSAPGTER